MSVAREEILRIATLARLRLDEEDLARMTEELNAILGHVDDLSALEDVEARAAGLLEGVASTRSEERTLPGDEPLDPEGIAPDFRERFFVVPPPPGVHAQEGDA